MNMNMDLSAILKSPIKTEAAPFHCPKCDAVFATRYGCVRHVKNHDAEKKFICEVDGCRAEFKRNDGLKSHRIQHWQQEQSPIQCLSKGCCLEFSNLGELRGHLRRDHKLSQENRADCKECGRSFGSLSSMLIHYYSVHVRGERDGAVRMKTEQDQSPGNNVNAGFVNIKTETVQEESVPPMPRASDSAESDGHPTTNEEILNEVRTLAQSLQGVLPPYVLQLDHKCKMRWVKREDVSVNPYVVGLPLMPNFEHLF